MILRRVLPFALPLATLCCTSAKPDVGQAPAETSGGAGPSFGFDAGLSGDADYDAANCYASPGSADAFAPVTVQPLVNHVCTSEQIDDFVRSCFGTDTSFCETWTKDSANAECFAGCLVSPYGAAVSGGAAPTPGASWGPVIDVSNPGNSTWFNVAACIGLSDPTKAQCASDLSARFQCEIAVCSPVCPVPPVLTIPDASVGYYTDPLTNFQNCVQQADYEACSSYASAVSTSCTLSEPDAGPAAFCFSVGSGATGTPGLTQLLDLQCGK